MKKLLFILLLCPSLLAQNKSVNATWVASASTGVTGYNLYRAPCTNPAVSNACTEGTFAKINSALITGTSYVDSVPPGQAYSYYATSYCPTCVPSESTTASNHYALNVPPGAPLPPSGFGVTNASLVINNRRTETFTATILDAPGLKVNWTLANPLGRRLQSGSATVPVIGRFSLKWSGRPVAYVVFSAKDSAGNTFNEKYSIS